MDPAQLVAFNAVLLAAMASPGPALLLALRTSLVQGPRAGIATGAGLALIAAAWTGAGLLGLDIVFALFPWAYAAIKTAGALYLIWLAVSMWRNARNPLPATPPNRGHAFRTGILVNLGNPKSVLFASAVLAVIFPPDLTLADKGFIVLNHLCVELIAYTGLALLLTTGPARRAWLGARTGLDRVAAAVLGALGLRLLLEH
ncbi:LysE family translocator [Pukyongiella litopenaei]|uniref:LysE family translocator n=1 Tax=Pukyongiella litopenaei TaxID=2605946 RepID=A0A2S0MTS1_9RHOB|nr:LysE family translocator [Pukyongiella litopenaei]AVO39262.1 LysE family translocator [Pukyongiella litopenaei]